MYPDGDCPGAKNSELSSISPDFTPCNGNHLGSLEPKSPGLTSIDPKDLSFPILSESKTSILKTNNIKSHSS